MLVATVPFGVRHITSPGASTTSPPGVAPASMAYVATRLASIKASSSAPSGGRMRPRSHALGSESSRRTAWTLRNPPGTFAPSRRARGSLRRLARGRPHHGGRGKDPPMSRFRSNKRAKELQRKAKHEAKEARKRERRENAAEGVDDD